MKLKLLALFSVTAVIVCVSTRPAHALAPFVQYQDTEDAGAAYGLGLKHALLGPIPIVGFELRASWLHFADEKLVSGFEMFPLEVAGTLKLGIFYGAVGVGYYVSTGDFKPDNSVGEFVAGGITFGLGGLGAFAEARYLFLEPGAAKLNGIGVNAGVTLPI